MCCVGWRKERKMVVVFSINSDSSTAAAAGSTDWMTKGKESQAKPSQAKQRRGKERREREGKTILKWQPMRNCNPVDRLIDCVQVMVSRGEIPLLVRGCRVCSSESRVAQEVIHTHTLSVPMYKLCVQHGHNHIRVWR